MNATCLEPVNATIQLSTSSEPLGVLAARSACGLEDSIQRFTASSDQNLGHLEVQPKSSPKRIETKNQPDTLEEGAVFSRATLKILALSV